MKTARCFFHEKRQNEIHLFSQVTIKTKKLYDLTAIFKCEIFPGFLTE